jgi:DNA-binding response OmpR family regulator
VAATILVVEDEPAVARGIQYALQQEGYGVTVAPTGEIGLETATTQAPDLVLLDVRLPGIDGFEVLRRLEATGKNVPVILVTSLEDELDQLVGYRLGAIDFVTKPVSPKVLAAKAKAFIARLGGRVEAPATTVCGPVSIEHDAFRALVDGVDVRLTAREFGLLVALADHPGWVYSRNHLLFEVWGIDGERIETRLVDQHVANLRRKLAAAGADGFVETVRGIGYRIAVTAS